MSYRFAALSKNVLASTFGVAAGMTAYDHSAECRAYLSVSELPLGATAQPNPSNSAAVDDNKVRPVFVPAVTKESAQRFEDEDYEQVHGKFVSADYDCASSDSSNDHHLTVEQENYLYAFKDQPATVHEVDAAMETLRPRLEAIMPARYRDLSSQHINQLFNAVKEIVTDPDLIASTCKRIREKSDEREETVDKSTKTTAARATHNKVQVQYCRTSNDDALQAEWQKLADKYPCCICQDLLSAPHVLNCSHSYCAVCIDDLLSTCASCDTEVVHHCPMCQTNIEHMSFERLLDEDILARINHIPDAFPSKMAWNERHNSYLDAKQSIPQKHKQRMGRDDGGVTLEDLWEEVQAWAVPFLVFTVIALITACRNSK